MPINTIQALPDIVACGSFHQCPALVGQQTGTGNALMPCIMGMRFIVILDGARWVRRGRRTLTLQSDHLPMLQRASFGTFSVKHL